MQITSQRRSRSQPETMTRLTLRWPKKIIEKAPTVTGVEWKVLSGGGEVPEKTLLLISFANIAAVMTGYIEDGVFKTPGGDIFGDYGLVVNAWCVCPQGYESEDL